MDVDSGRRVSFALFIAGFVEKGRFGTAQDPRQLSGRWTSILRIMDLCRSMCNLMVVIALSWSSWSVVSIERGAGLSQRRLSQQCSTFVVELQFQSGDCEWRIECWSSQGNKTRINIIRSSTLLSWLSWECITVSNKMLHGTFRHSPLQCKGIIDFVLALSIWLSDTQTDFCHPVHSFLRSVMLMRWWNTYRWKMHML